MKIPAGIFDLKIFLRRLAVYRFAVKIFRIVKKGVTQGLQLCVRSAMRSFPKAGFPNGFYSLLDEIRMQECPSDGRVVLEDQGVPFAGTDSLMVRCRLRQHQEQPWPIFWCRRTAARLIGESLSLINFRKELALEAVYGWERSTSDPAWHYFSFGTPTKLDGPWTSIISRWVPCEGATNFCHWLTEAIPRLAILDELPADTHILVPKSLQPFQVKTLEWLGVLDRCVGAPATQLEIETYYFSAPPCMIVCYSPYSIQFLRTRFLGRASARLDLPRRFYLRRRGRHRSIVNEEELFCLFASLGWAVVDTADMPMDDQISLFMHAEAIVATHGAGLTNIAWCRAGCKVLEICADQYLNSVYEWISHVVGATHSYLVFPSDHALNSKVDISEVRKVLRSWDLDRTSPTFATGGKNR